jgi:hypothetical protein
MTYDLVWYYRWSQLWRTHSKGRRNKLSARLLSSQALTVDRDPYGVLFTRLMFASVADRYYGHGKPLGQYRFILALFLSLVNIILVMAFLIISLTG